MPTFRAFAYDFGYEPRYRGQNMRTPSLLVEAVVDRQCSSISMAINFQRRKIVNKIKHEERYQAGCYGGMRDTLQKLTGVGNAVLRSSYVRVANNSFRQFVRGNPTMIRLSLGGCPANGSLEDCRHERLQPLEERPLPVPVCPVSLGWLGSAPVWIRNNGHHTLWRPLSEGSCCYKIS